jgi:outer membrane lipoprotein-sorting protein
MRIVFLLLLSIFIKISGNLSAQSVRSTLDKMYIAIGSLQTMSYDMTSQERIGKRIEIRNSKFKIQVSPKKLYMKNQDSGVELLYVAGWNNNKPFINPNGFPYVNVSFDVNSPKVRNDGHHPITHAGFSYLYTQVKNTEKKLAANGQKLEDIITIAGDYTWNGKSCTKLIMDNPDFQFISYTCTQSESLLSLCERINVSEYLVMEKNNLGYGANVSKGMVLKVPNAFAKKAELYIDKSSGIPIYQVVYDDKGVFEKYEFKNLKINPNFNSAEFTTQCAGYGF